MGRYPLQLSGGMQQRVVIAMALATDPSLLILDEPTTGLDATVEAEVLDLVAGCAREFGTSILFISHNLGVIASMCDRVGVLYAGELVEEGPAQQVLHDPRHPVQRRPAPLHPAARSAQGPGAPRHDPGFLPQLGAISRAASSPIAAHWPRTSARREAAARRPRRPARPAATSTRRPRSLPARRRRRWSAAAVDRSRRRCCASTRSRRRSARRPRRARARRRQASLWPGETLGLVGESGSGKTTFARTLLGIVEPTRGHRRARRARAARRFAASALRDDVRAVQIVFQNPDSALNRRHSVRKLLAPTLKKLAGLKARKPRRACTS